MCTGKCVMCGATIIDYTDNPNIFSTPLQSNERRGVKVEGKLACSYYKYQPPMTCAAILSRRLTEQRLKKEWNIRCPQCDTDNVSMFQCLDCDGGTWVCNGCGHEWEDEGEPCRCESHDTSEEAYLTTLAQDYPD